MSPFRITELYAFLSVGEDGDEGVCAFLNPADGVWMPMVAADARRLELLRPIAEQLAKETHKTIILCRFAPREEIQTIGEEH